MEQPASTTIMTKSADLDTYAALQQQVTRQSINRFLRKGMGGPLVFLGSVGAGVLLVLLNSPPLALGWTGAVSALGVAMLLFDLRDRKVWALALESVMAKWFLTHAIPDLTLGAEVQTGTETFAQIALQIAEIEKRHGADPYLRRVLGQSYGLLALQYQQAIKAATLEAGENPELRQEEAAQAYFLTREALVQLETVSTVLRALQRARPSHDLAERATELARETEETLRRMQAGPALPGPDRSGPDPDAPSPTPVPLPSPQPGISDLAAQRRADRYSPLELRQLREALQDRLTRLNSSEGLRALNGLVREYGQLRAMLASTPDASSLTIAQTRPLAEEAYRQGLSVLGDALLLIQDTSGPDLEQQERETAALEGEIAALQGDARQPGRLAELQGQLAAKQKGLEPVRRRRLRLEQRLDRCRRYQESLDQAREGLEGLKDDSAESRVSAVTEPLHRVIDQAKEVQEELKREGW